ncbi:hypothetical protein TNCV_4999361 [Trichonephila clavipes]|nr:hypothetical protein TNCV_4999361 [Trichonephila clavipes]
MSSFLGFCEGDTRNRWRDGQVCPDVDKELWRLGPDGSGERGEKKGQESPGRENGRKEEERRKREGDGKRVGERESDARLEWKKGLSPEIGVKKTMNAGGVDCQVIYSQFVLAIHQNDHQARRRFVEWAQNEIAVVPDFHKRILFSDEAHFWLNGYVNVQNCRIWSEANPQVYVEPPLHPWGYVKSLVYADKPKTLDRLEDNIRRVIADIRPQILEKLIKI